MSASRGPAGSPDSARAGSPDAAAPASRTAAATTPDIVPGAREHERAVRDVERARHAAHEDVIESPRSRNRRSPRAGCPPSSGGSPPRSSRAQLHFRAPQRRARVQQLAPRAELRVHAREQFAYVEWLRDHSRSRRGRAAAAMHPRARAATSRAPGCRASAPRLRAPAARAAVPLGRGHVEQQQVGVHRAHLLQHCSTPPRTDRRPRSRAPSAARRACWRAGRRHRL